MRPESSDPLRTDELRNPGCPRRFTALRKFPQGGGALAIRFFGSTCVFPGKQPIHARCISVLGWAGTELTLLALRFPPLAHLRHITCNRPTVVLVVSRLRGRAVQRTPQGTQLSLGRFRLYVPSLAGRIPRTKPMRREAAGSAGLHLFQELSTLGQQLAHALLLRQGCGRVKPMFPASTARPLQPFGGSRSGAGAAVHSLALFLEISRPD